MGSTCGTLNVHETAIVTTWTDRKIRHGPVGCFCYIPCINSVDKRSMTELKIHECALLQDTRDPSLSRYIYGPTLFRLEHPYQNLGPIRPVSILDQNDYIIVTERNGNKRNEIGPRVLQPLHGETYSSIREALNLKINEYIVLQDKANNERPIRHLRGPAKVYPSPYEEPVPEEKQQIIRKCLEINESQALWVKHADGQILLLDQPQFYMPAVGEVIERIVNKTLLKESEFCIMIMPSGQNVLKMGNVRDQRAFFLPPFHRFLPFKLGENRTTEIFHTLPDFIPVNFTIRTSDNVQIQMQIRISFSIFETNMYVCKPIDFYTQIIYWTQNELLDTFAQQTFRDFLKFYADSAKKATQAAHETFNEFGIRLLDIQLIQFNCLDPKTQALLDSDIITRVTKQNELLAKEADVEIMKRSKEVELQRMDIDFEKNEKENLISIKKKELDVALRMKEVSLQIQEEHKRTELMEIKKQNVVKEGSFEGEAQGRAIASFLEHLPNELALDKKVELWRDLRELDKSAMIYSKVSSIELYPPGVDVKKFDVRLDKEARPLMDKSPFLLPSILGYSGDNNDNQNGHMNGINNSYQKQNGVAHK